MPAVNRHLLQHHRCLSVSLFPKLFLFVRSLWVELDPSIFCPRGAKDATSPSAWHRLQQEFMSHKWMTFDSGIFRCAIHDSSRTQNLHP